ncbi:GNAT family N-acetyltransferase [Oribacterium sp. WCC10]|uniref:GNAT family N-acetyltransferase n=1 Tax=Oribacterium sp. WCC10 TaxID=1855343 RepID=UPI0008E1E399|nr:GNAT family N-acetyltransferase [Oribacterium sp. WCC10]SFG18492.1 phosphinothricin acetyltransferase [Oribacterium sp. WCC10]
MKNDIIVRKASIEDAAELLDIYAPYVEKTAITFEYTVPELSEFERRIGKVLERYPYIVAEQDGKPVGYAYVSPFHERAAYDWCVETSIYIEESQKRSGIGKRLYYALEDILKKQGILNLNACIAYPDMEDEHLTRNSVMFHEHLGYSMVGEFHKCGYKFKRWYNMVWMEKPIGEHLEEQPPVRRFDEVLDEIDFEKY